MTRITVLEDVTESLTHYAIWIIESSVCIAVYIWMFAEGAEDTTSAKYSFAHSQIHIHIHKTCIHTYTN